MWADGEPIDPSPTIDQAVNGGYSSLILRFPLRKYLPQLIDRSCVTEAGRCLAGLRT